MPPKKRNKADDHFFRESMQNEHLVKDFLRTFLTPSIAGTVNFSSLSLKKDLWVDTDLSEHLADIVYEAQLKNRTTHVYFLFEHKSKPDKKVFVQTSRYINMIWKNHQKRHEDAQKDPQIYAIIVYNGNQNWNIDNSSHRKTAYFKDSLFPEIEWIFIDIKHNGYKIDNKLYLLKAFIRSLRYVNTRELFDRMPEILSLFRGKNADKEYLSVIINYFYSTIDSKEYKRFFELIKAEYNRGGTMKTFTDILKEEGEKNGLRKGFRKGIEKGVEKGIQKGIQKGIRKGRKAGIQQGRKTGIQQGIKQGIIEGERKGKSEQKEKEQLIIAKNMLAKKVSEKEIAEFTGLPVKKILTLKNKHRKKNAAKKPSKEAHARVP